MNHRMSYKKLSKGLELIEKYKETGANVKKRFFTHFRTKLERLLECA